MKFKDKDGNVFEDILCAKRQFCEKTSCSDTCPISILKQVTNALYCSNAVLAHPAEAARLMGYEVIEVKEETMKQGKALSDWTLGEVKEYCKNADPECVGCIFLGTECCRLDDVPERWDLTDPPRFTTQEVEDARTIDRLYEGEIEKIHRTANCSALWLFSTGGWSQKINSEMFPTIKKGETVKLSDIIASERSGE